MTMPGILVTGGSGFIGSNFIRYYLQEHRDVSIINLDKLTYAGNRANTRDFERDSRYEFIHGDICDQKLVRKLIRRVAQVVHFASETHVDRSIASGADFVQTNVVGTQVLLEAAKGTPLKRFLHFSTDEVYGSCANGSCSEDDALHPTSPYSASKAASDLLALAYWKTHHVPITIIRGCNNFGPFQYPEKVIPLFITNLIEGKKVPLYARGENVREWMYVGDSVQAIDLVLERSAVGEIYNLSTKDQITNKELTHLILAEFGRGEEAIQYVADRPAHDFRYSLDTSKLERLGFEPHRGIRDRLRETIRWYREHQSWWKPLKKDSFTLK